MQTTQSPKAGERTQQLKELRKLLKQFKTTGFENGDLVITAEVHVVTDKSWGRKNGANGMSVVTLYPACSTCRDAKQHCLHSRIMTGGSGQQSVMKLISNSSH